MKKRIIILLLLFCLPLIIVKAETVFDDYKVEILLDEDDIFKVTESFRVVSIDEQYQNGWFYKGAPNNYYNPYGNLPEFSTDYYYNYYNYWRFKLVEGETYHLDYYVKDKNAFLGGYEYYDYSQITANISDYNSIKFNTFALTINLNKGFDITDMYNYSNMNVQRVGDTITGFYQQPVTRIESFEIKKPVYNELDNSVDYYESDEIDSEYGNNNPFNMRGDTFSFFEYVVFLLLIPCAVLLVSIYFKIRIKKTIEESVNTQIDVVKLKKIYRCLIIITIVSYILSVNARALSTHSLPIIIVNVVIMAFYMIFYWAVFFSSDGTVSWFAKVFIVFHSLIFALTMGGFAGSGDEIELSGIIVIIFIVGFIINAISLEVISSIRKKVKKLEKKDDNVYVIG